MADRVKVLLQKRSSVKAQITNLTNVLDKGALDRTVLKLRIARLTELYHAFEERNDELAVLDPDDNHQVEFLNIQDRFYSLAARIEGIVNVAEISIAGTSNNETQSTGSEPANVVKKRRIKLPEAPLPTFDGSFEGWLSFKNAFRSMIDGQTDLTDIDKLHYLRAALKGEAANKVRILEVDGINYRKAWELLVRSYEVKRILISRHLSFILNSPVLDKETTSGLSKLADDIQQHLASLNALGVSVGPEMIVHIIEGKLPKVTLNKWEATLERDEFPSLEQFYEFLYKTAVCASRRERGKPHETDKAANEPPAKRKRPHSSIQTFVLNATRNCITCKTKRHPLYMCDKFKQLPVTKRIETVRNARLCYNCLRSHRDSPCKFSNCTVCQKRHNTLLHFDKFSKSGHATVSNAEASTSKAE